jgi:hypothetical protein
VICCPEPTEGTWPTASSDANEANQALLYRVWKTLLPVRIAAHRV